MFISYCFFCVAFFFIFSPPEKPLRGPQLDLVDSFVKSVGSYKLKQRQILGKSNVSIYKPQSLTAGTLVDKFYTPNPKKVDFFQDGMKFKLGGNLFTLHLPSLKLT